MKKKTFSTAGKIFYFNSIELFNELPIVMVIHLKILEEFYNQVFN